MQKAMQRLAVQGGPAAYGKAERKKIPEWMRLFLVGAAGGLMIAALIGIGLAGVV